MTVQADRVRFIAGENRAMMLRLFDAGERFTLAYLDPPFFSAREYKTASGDVAFDDRWQSFDDYQSFVLSRMSSAWRLLEPGGSLVVHVDPTASHYLKVGGDAQWGRSTFASEIVWRYRRWPAKCRNLQAMHDVLLRWVKPGAEPRFNQLYDPLSASTVETFKGSKQRVTHAERRASQRVARTTDELSPGAPLSDVWEIPIVAPSGDERTGYPTQKPEALLERLVLSFTNEGDAVLDPFCGSGTSLSVCHRLNRRCVGIDQSPVAARTIEERLAPIRAQGQLFEASK